MENLENIFPSLVEARASVAQGAFEHGIEIYCEILQDVDPDDEKTPYLYLEYADALIKNSDSFFIQEVSKISDKKGLDLNERKEVEEDLEIAWNLLEICKNAFMILRDYSSLATCRYLLGEINMLNNEFHDGLHELIECVSAMDKAYEKDSIMHVDVYQSMANCYELMGDFSMSKKYYEKMIVVYKNEQEKEEDEEERSNIGDIITELLEKMKELEYKDERLEDVTLPSEPEDSDEWIKIVEEAHGMDEVEVWRMKKLLKSLRDSRGNGTSMISIIIPPKDQVSRVNKMLTDEYGTASNIKSRVNRLSVLGAITSAQNKLKQYNRTPTNGLGVFVGTVMVDQNKEKKISVGVEPIKPVNTSLYMCDSKFHVDDLLSLFEDELRYGFIVMDGHCTVFATLMGNVKTILQQISVDLPKKHGRGGQSSVRFARLRVEKRNAYTKKVSEIATSLFLTNSVMNVEGLILAGQSDLKTELSQVLDSRIKVIKLVDTNYGGEGGLNQAIELSEDVLKDVKLSKEKKIIQELFNEINTDSGRYCFTMNDTMQCLEMGAVEKLIVYEDHGDMKDEESFVDWIAENYKNFGCSLMFISDKSSEGVQFIEGFGGIGGILRYRVDIEEYGEEDYSSNDEEIF